MVGDGLVLRTGADRRRVKNRETYSRNHARRNRRRRSRTAVRPLAAPQPRADALSAARARSSRRLTPTRGTAKRSSGLCPGRANAAAYRLLARRNGRARPGPRTDRRGSGSDGRARPRAAASSPRARAELLVGKLGQPRVAHRVRSDFEAALEELREPRPSAWSAPRPHRPAPTHGSSRPSRA